MAQQRNSTSLAGRVSADLAHDYAQRALRGAPTMTETEAQVLWALCNKLKAEAQNAEHSAFLLYSEQASGLGHRLESAEDYQGAMRQQLAEVRDQLKAVSRLLSGGIEALRTSEREAAA